MAPAFTANSVAHAADKRGSRIVIEEQGALGSVPDNVTLWFVIDEEQTESFFGF